MSFSTDVKEELSKISNLSNKQCVKLEFLGYCKSNNVSIIDNSLRFSTESEYNINRFGKLLNNLNINDYKIELQGKSYVITSKNKELLSFLQGEIQTIDKIEQIKIVNDIEEKAFVRGCFLGSGSINNPENKYHMEIIFRQQKDVNFVLDILAKYSINFKLLEKTNNYSIYSKDGEEISKFLAFIGANSSVLKFEDIRVYREMRNNVNRLVNCETANLTKTVGAAVKQIDAIKLIKEKGKLASLTDNLQEIAELRIKYPEASLIELGKMANPPIGKSGVNHRLKAIIKIAEELPKGTEENGNFRRSIK